MTDVSLLPLKTGFTIYQSPSCPYCRRALGKIQELNVEYQIPYRNVNLENVSGGLPDVLEFFKTHSKQYKFDHHHKTRPIIFFNGRFLGGASELSKIVDGVG